MQQSPSQALFKRILFSPLVAAVIVFLILFLVFETVSMVRTSIRTSKSRKDAAAELADLTAKREALEHKLALLDSDDGKEAILREQFPVVKEGEQVVVITDQDKKIPVTQTSAQSGGFWNWMKGLFK
jgi:cell division protein FtsB